MPDEYHPTYSGSRALVVGIDSYTDGRFVPLGEAEADAKLMADVLSAPPYSFQVDGLFGKDATKAAIQDALFRLYHTGSDDRVLIYFAGHGYTLTDNFGNETGYLACYDTVAEKHFTALELNEVITLCRHSKAKHIAFVLDACFSGQALGLTRAPGVAADKFLLRRAYQVISAGAGDQTVSDFRSMTRLLVDALREAAEHNELLTFNALGLRAQQAMALDSGQMQIPQFGHLKGSQGGDLVLYVPPQVSPIEKLPLKLRRPLTSKDPDVRCSALDVAETMLSDPEHGQAVRAVLEEMAVDDPDRDVRRRALEALRAVPATLAPPPAAPAAPPAPSSVPPSQPSTAPAPMPEANIFSWDEEPTPASTNLPFEPELVAIPAGSFTMGSQRGYGDESPPHTVELDSYAIGVTPVTVGQYRVFVEAGGYRERKYWTEPGWKWIQDLNVAEPRYWDEAEWTGDDDLPVVGVHWHEAVAYCNWLAEATGFAYRLPTEAEWEKAARGTDERLYPWGNEFDSARCNTSESNLGRTTPVGRYPQGASPYGVLDMSGGVWEWTSSANAPYPYDPTDGREAPDAPGRRIVRGGSWYDSGDSARVTYRDNLNPYDRHCSVGFRVACSLVVPEG